MGKIFAIILTFCGVSLAIPATAEEVHSSYKIDFSAKETRSGRDFPKGWSEKGTKWGVPNTLFYIKKDESNGNGNVLVVEANKATGAIIYDVYRHVNLSKTPIMRWRWRVQELPTGADGRNPEKDDQAVSIYVGMGSLIRKSIAYRWETETPIGASGNACYGGGLVKVTWFCTNNKTTPAGKWIVLERNIAEDFKKIYGEVPREFVVSVGGNSQYTQSRAMAEINYIEFVPLSESGKNITTAQK